MKTGVNIQFTNTRTGVASSADGVALLLVHAAAVASKFSTNKLYKLTQMSDLEALGIDAAYDSSKTVSVYRQISEFYAAAGDGAVLYLIGIEKSTNMSAYVAGDEFPELLQQTGISADGNPSPDDRTRMVGVVFYPQEEAPSTGSYYEDVLPTATALNTTLENLWNEGFRAFAVLDGNNLKGVADAPDFKTQECPRVAIHDTTATKDSCASVGLVLGILSREAVNYEPGNVSAGPLPIQNAWFTDGTPVSSVIPATFDTLGSKQHLFIRTRATKSGYYFNDGATAEDSTMSLSTIPANRVLNKISDYLQEYLTDVIGATPPLNSQGNVDDGYLATLEENFYTTYTNPMIANGEIAGISVNITNEGVFSSTRTLNAAVSILQRPGVAEINANITFVTSL
jgi:hypothetical protein